MKIAIITISDRASQGQYADLSGPAIRTILHQALPDAILADELVPDEKHLIQEALHRHADSAWIITTGGTGIGPRDITPEATRELCDRELPGVMEWLRRRSLDETPFAIFSRGYCGLLGHCIVVNLPGSLSAARFCTGLLVPVLEHGHEMVLGHDHGHAHHGPHHTAQEHKGKDKKQNEE